MLYKNTSFFLRKIVGPAIAENAINALKNPYSKCEDDYKCIFVHVPKAAGKSIARSLLDAKNSTGHNKIAHYEKNKNKFSEYKKITVVRNPWDRLVSAFFYLRNLEEGTNGRVFFDGNVGRGISFNEFVLNLESSDYKKKVLRWQHFSPQTWFLRDSRGRIEFDFIARVESLEEDYKILKKIVNPNAGALRVVNKSKHSDYRSYYDQKTMNIVSQVYEDDIRELGYFFK